MSAEEGIPTNQASDRLAENRIRNVAKSRAFYTNSPRRVTCSRSRSISTLLNLVPLNILLSP